MVEIKVPVFKNKKNGQINTYFKQKQLPREIVNILKKKNFSVKNFLIDFKGVE